MDWFFLLFPLFSECKPKLKLKEIRREIENIIEGNQHSNEILKILIRDTPNKIENSVLNVDLILSQAVLEHVENLEAYTQSLKDLLKENGTLLIAVPNYKSFDATYYGAFWAAFDVPRHLWHFSKTAIEKLFDNQNMNLEDVKPMWFDSFYVSLLSEKYKTGKMNFISGFFIGFISKSSNATDI